MNRRQFIQTVGTGAATACLAACSAPGGPVDETTDGATGGTADVSVVLVRNAPENPGPYENPAGTVTAQESAELALEEFTFQRAGEKGLVVAGDATNTGDRRFRTVVVEVSLHDTNETGNEVVDSATELTSHDSLDTGERWQWATTFDEQEFQIDYFVIRATANYA